MTRSLCFIQGTAENTQKEACAHERTKYPSSLFDPRKEDGTQYVMRSGTKSDFMQPILQEANVQQSTNFPKSPLPNVFVTDLMAFV